MSLPPTERDDVEIPKLSPTLRAALAERLGARDLPGALTVARDAAAGEPGRTEMIVALARLVAAMERLEHEGTTATKGTVPLDRHGFVLFQLRMGNLEDAEGALRQLVADQPNDHVARERLRDVVLVRRALEERSEQPPAAPGWLDKRKSRLTGEGWAPVAKKAPSDDWDEGVETSVLRPEQEAELLLRSGQPERALEVYRRLLEKAPGRTDLVARMREIEALLEDGRAPIPGEVTVQRDVRSLVDPRATGPDGPSAPATHGAAEVPMIADDAATIFGRRATDLVSPELLALGAVGASSSAAAPAPRAPSAASSGAASPAPSAPSAAASSVPFGAPSTPMAPAPGASFAASSPAFGASAPASPRTSSDPAIPPPSVVVHRIVRVG